MDLVVAGADLALAVDHEPAVGELAVFAAAPRASRDAPRCRARARRLAARGKHLILRLAAQTLGGARSRSRSSRPDISGVNSIAAPPAAACSTASTSALGIGRAGRSGLRLEEGDPRHGQAASNSSSLPSRSSVDQVVAAADMMAVDEDLRDGRAAIGALDHLLLSSARRNRPRSPDTRRPSFEQPLGAQAVSRRTSWCRFRLRHDPSS